MAPFYVDGGGTRQLRLSCGFVEPDVLVEGVARLARFVSDEAAR